MDANAPEVSGLSDEELLEELRGMKPSPVFDALFIGFLIGILIFSAAKSAWGLASLIPLYLIFVFLRKPKRRKALEREIDRRGLSVR